MRIATLGIMILLIAVTANFAVAQQPRTLEDRIETLEKQLQAIEAHLGKLDVIGESIEALRNDDLRKIQRDIRGTRESMDRRSADGESSDAVGAARAGSPENADQEAPSDSETESLVDLAQRKALLGRTKTVEETVAAIQRQLGKLDDIAEQLHVIRSEDLAKIHRDIRGTSETGDRSVRLPDEDVVDGERAANDTVDGTVVINNLTFETYTVSINGESRLVPPGRTTIKAPYGPIRAGLPGFETEREWPVTHWQKVGDAYQITLDLQSRQ